MELRSLYRKLKILNSPIFLACVQPFMQWCQDVFRPSKNSTTRVSRLWVGYVWLIDHLFSAAK